jgi:DNA-binding winged helix-turn-helix (wHTH) protein
MEYSWKFSGGRVDHHRPFRFASFHVDVDDKSVWREGSRLELAPKPFGVLCYFVAHPGRLVTLDDLKQAVWGTRHIGNATVVSAIKTVRQVLGDTATAPRFLATVRGRGYRFLGDLPQSVNPALPTPRPIVGREEELTLLTRFLTETEEARRRVVFITGELGIGKTSLIETFVQRLAPRERYWLMQGNGIESNGAGEPYLPFFSAFGDLARGREASAITALLRHTAPTWLAQMPWLVRPTDRTFLARELPGVTTPPMLGALAEVLETLARQRPVIFVLEDMHWSDQASLAALAYLARRLAPSRLLFLVTYRPEDAALRQHPVDELRLELCTHRLAETLLLRPLGATGMVAYLRQRFGASTLPETLIQRLYQQTEGHPLFLVTLVDDLVTRGVLAQEGSAWQVQGSLAEDLQAVPATLQALVLHRLRRLSSEEQRVLRAGSVAGIEFAAALAGPDGSATLATEAVCEGLAQRGLFLEPGWDHHAALSLSTRPVSTRDLCPSSGRGAQPTAPVHRRAPGARLWKA